MFKGYFPGIFAVVGMDPNDGTSMFTANGDEEYQWKIKSIFKQRDEEVYKIRVDKVHVATDNGTKVWTIAKL